MTAWWPSAAVVSLRNEVDARWPNRSKVFDGMIGDAAHQAEGAASDHNPRPDGEVCAFDITAAGIDPGWLATHLAERATAGDTRVKYVIWSRAIFDLSVSASWRPYAGTDPHLSHVHLSVVPHAAAAPPWQVTPTAPVLEVSPMLVIHSPNHGAAFLDDAGTAHPMGPASWTAVNHLQALLPAGVDIVLVTDADWLTFAGGVG